jgi:hypothetical protein
MPSPPDPRLAENLRRWIASGQPRAWVESRSGGWSESDWLVLLGNLRYTELWPMDPAAVGAELERLGQEKRQRDNLRRWVASGRARHWVEAQRGRWGRKAVLSLLEELRGSGFWPLEPEAVQAALDELRVEWQNLRRWEKSGAPRRWVQSHGGGWSHGDWLGLVRDLRRSEFWPLDPAAIGSVLETMKQAIARPAPRSGRVA